MDMDDLADLLSDCESEKEASVALRDDFELIDFESPNSRDTESDIDIDTDPFAIDNESDSSPSETEELNAESTDAIKSDSQSNANTNDESMYLLESESDNSDSEMASKHSYPHDWPSNDEYNGSFAERTIVVKNLPPSITNEAMLFQRIFYDIPPTNHPIDIRMYRNRYCNTNGYAHIIFNDPMTIDAIQPLLAHKKQFELHRGTSVNATMIISDDNSNPTAFKDVICDHFVRDDLADTTLRLMFINVNTKANSLQLYHWIVKCLSQTYGGKHKHLIPIRIQIVEDSNGFTTSCAYIDCCDAITASKVLVACHWKEFMDRSIFVDWYPDTARVKKFVEQQKKWKETLETVDSDGKSHSLLLNNLTHGVSEAEIRTFLHNHINQLLSKNSGLSQCEIVDLRLIHNRNSNVKCGHCFVTLSDPQLVLPLQNRIQYRILSNRSIYAMLVRDQKSFIVSEQLRNKTQWLLLSNLVWNVTSKDIKIFCSEIEVPIKIEIIVDNHGYPTGTALIKFRTPEKATEILTALQKKSISDRSVYIDWCDIKAFKSTKQFSNNLHITQISSQLNETQMRFLEEQLFGKYTRLGGRKMRDRRRNRNDTSLHPKSEPIESITTQSDPNKDILDRLNQRQTSLRIKRKRQHSSARQTMVDSAILAKLKNGETLDTARPKSAQRLRTLARGKTRKGVWTDLGMSKGKFDHLKTKVNWATGKSVVSSMIAKKKTVKFKNYWRDSLRFSRRRQRNRLYMQKNDHSKFRKK